MLLSCDNKLSFRFISVFFKSLSLHVFFNNCLVNLHFNFLLSMHMCTYFLFCLVASSKKKERKRKKEKKKYINSEEFLRIPQHPRHRSLHLFLIIRHSRQNMKNKNKLLLPFSINSRSFAPAFHASLHLFLYIFQFPYRTEMDTAFLFHIKHPLNKL